MKPPVIGLTGPMCAGKNLAAAFLARRGYAVADADKIAHQALEDVRDRVVGEFAEEASRAGIALTRADGSLDRRALGTLLFSNPAKLARHEAIVYPRIDELLSAFVDMNINRGVVINAPLLHKSSVLSRCDFVLFVDAPVVLRFFRALRRDHLSPRQITARFSAQGKLFAQYLLINVDIEKVHNRGSLRALERRLESALSRRGY